MRTLVVAVVLAVATAGTAAAQRSHLGIHGGYNLDLDEPLIGTQLHIPVGPRVEVAPSLDHYFVETGSRLGFNVDLKFRQPAGRSDLYLGGGMNLLRRRTGGVSNTDSGANLFLGFESRLGSTHPYFEVRTLLQDDTSVQLIAGLNFTLF
jgi:hypothetical protein